MKHLGLTAILISVSLLWTPAPSDASHSGITGNQQPGVPGTLTSFQTRSVAEGTSELKEVLESSDELKRLQKVWGADFTREKFHDWVRRWHRDNPGITTTQMAVAIAVLESPRALSPFSTMDPRLCNEVTGHAQYMASVQVQGHQNWDSRRARLGGYVSEIASESWPNPPTLMKAARDCVNPGWFQSSGHRFHMDGGHSPLQGTTPNNTGFCYDMRQGSNGIWYCDGIMEYTDKRFIQ